MVRHILLEREDRRFTLTLPFILHTHTHFTIKNLSWAHLKPINFQSEMEENHTLKKFERRDL